MTPGRMACLSLFVVLSTCGGGGGGSGRPPAPPPALRSALYPEDWTPAFTDAQGRFLHDFSYAGYRRGEVPLPSLPGAAEFDVASGYGADPTGAADSTAAIQAAIDAAEAAGGGIVRFPAGLFRVDGVLAVEASGVVLRGAGPAASRLAFTKSEGMSYRSHLTVRGSLAAGADRPLAADAASRGSSVLVADAAGLSPGDDVLLGIVITDEFVAEHGMTGVWTAFAGTWQPFFRRTVTAVDTGASPHVVALDVPLRYALKTRDGASLRPVRGYLREVGVEGLGLSNAVAEAAAWENNQVHALELAGVADAWVKDVASFASPFGPGGENPHLSSGGIVVRDSERVTVADCRMEMAQHRGGGGNGYLFELRTSGEVLFRDCVGRRGRHNFIQNWGFGATGCVFLRCTSTEGEALNDVLGILVPVVGLSEYHHSLATANLVDGGTTDDGWSAINRGFESSGAGHTSTECVFWRIAGTGLLRSGQYGIGYVIGPGPGIRLSVTGDDVLEAAGLAADLVPASLHEDQLARRLARPAK